MYVCKNNKTIILLASSGVPSLNRGRRELNIVFTAPEFNTESNCLSSKWFCWFCY